jgi:uncharacterized protein YbjT (DUF2867 family)
MKLLIVGANGLVGQAVLDAALAAPDVDAIVTLTRRPPAATGTPVAAGAPSRSLVLPRYDDDALATLDLAGLDACVHCAGVLPVGMGEADYRALTVDLSLRLCRAFARANPAGRFVYVSGAGADAASWLMPLRVKGQAEDALMRQHPNSVMLRPGVVAPAAGLRSPHALRHAAYVIGGPALRLAARLSPRLLITSQALGRAALSACRSDTPAGVLEGLALQGPPAPRGAD